MNVLTNSSFMMRTQSLSMLVGAPNSFVKAFSVLYLKGGPATYGLSKRKWLALAQLHNTWLDGIAKKATEWTVICFKEKKNAQLIALSRIAKISIFKLILNR